MASDVPSPVEVADGLGEGLGLGVGDGVDEECVVETDAVGVPGDDAVPDDGVGVFGLTSALGVFFLDEPPKPRMTAKATTATAIAV